MMQPRLTGDELLDALEAGTVRAAEPQADGSWRVEPWVKEGAFARKELGGTAPLDQALGGIEMWILIER